jgi:probable HAF family extracellular repeat protein
MKPKFVLAALAAMFFFATVVLPVKAQDSQQDSAQVRYRVINLGTLGGSSSAGIGINELGWITGASNLSGDTTEEATLWAYGLKIPLKTLGGPNSAVLFPSKSNTGLVVGVSETAALDPNGEEWSCSFFFPSVTGHTCVGFIWKVGLMSPLPTLGGPNGFAAGINDFGRIVGWAENNFHDPTCAGANGRNQVLQFEPVIWGADGKIQKQLPPLPGDPDGAAVAINNAGEVVGISGTCDQAVGRFSAKHAVAWQNGTVRDLGDLGGVAWNTPDAINNLGDVVGFSNLPGGNPGGFHFHAVYWPKSGSGPDCGGRCIDLGTLPQDFLSEATGINNRGQIVGVSIGGSSPFGSSAFLWQNGKLVNLNSLVVPSTTLQLISTGDINDRGVITGSAIDPNSTGECGPSSLGCAFVAIPVSASDDK